MRLPRFLRVVLDPLSERVPVPVIGGLNRGRLWSLASWGGGYGTGRRAADQMALLRTLLRPGDEFWDVGAHHGYVTLMAAAAVGEHGAVQAFEPAERNGRMLRRHLAWNRVENGTAHLLALGSHVGEADFGGGYTSKMQSLGAGDERVVVRTASSLVRGEHGSLCPPDVMKIDVEGAEGDVLEGAVDILPDHARIVVAAHSRMSDDACRSLLRARGFETIPTPALTRARSQGGRWPGDPDLVAVGPEGSLPPEARALIA